MSVETRKRSNKAARTSGKATKMSNVATTMIDEAMNMSEEAAKMSGGAASRFLVVPSHSPRGFATRLLPSPYKTARYVGYDTPATMITYTNGM